MSGIFGHVDALPFIVGLIYFVGIWSIWRKLTGGRVFAGLLELVIFVALFKMHGGSVAGGVGATIASILVGCFLAPAAKPKALGVRKYARPSRR